ncbi:Gfo/Idh/MocA family protein [Bryobacter aggregatus]|uniref:Gfo/Idh/MocA family protein n=1 Tax=Bryobacter aggregatus TaxID=360054 RepID=UPI00138E0544|nr:Gfo/Idh/MocA family oxidoreductase [Bryobacter aggregatus]
MTRRSFAAAMSAAAYSRILGANDRVQVGFIGYGLIGAQHVFDFKNQRDADLAAVSETYQPRMEQGIQACGGKAKGYKDFRRLLDDKDLQAVVVSTPDHWHAMMTIMACAAGKDVYVEKPMTLFIKEGRWMINAARKHKRVVQVGTQQRSGLHYQEAKKLIADGAIGKVHSVRMASFRNIMPGFGKPTADQVPSELDYEMWCGPAPRRQYSPHRALYHFRWFWDYSGGQMTNLGAHQIDILQWYLGYQGPQAVYSNGGRFVIEDDGETPDTQDAAFTYSNKLTSLWSHREGSQGDAAGSGLEFYGTKGSLKIGRAGYEIIGDDKKPPENAIPSFQGHPTGGAVRTQTKPEKWIEAKSAKGSSPQQFDSHVRNFLDCIKTRQRTVADVEDGHYTAIPCHLANLSLRLGRALRWDGDKEEIIGDREANAMLERPYREPWAKMLKSMNLA